MDPSGKTALNWATCLAAVAAIFVLCIRLLPSDVLAHAAPSGPPPASGPLAVFHVSAAVAAAVLLAHVYADPAPLVVNYLVPGRRDIPEVQRAFRHIGRWTTFTVWCNTVGASYFWLASVTDLWRLLLADPPPRPILACKSVIWEITFPMAFLVNLVVSFVLIPACKKGGRLDKLEILLRRRPQCLHNGFVLVVATEAALASPRMAPQNFPIVLLYGMTYVVFAWVLWLRTRIFHYFFLDPRFRWAVPALLGLLALLAALHRAGCVAVAAATSARSAGAAIAATALCTCTFRDSALAGKQP